MHTGSSLTRHLVRRQMGQPRSACHFSSLQTSANHVQPSAKTPAVGPRDHYAALVERGEISHDRAQLRVVRAMQRVHESLDGFQAPNVSLLEAEIRRRETLKSEEANGGKMAQSVRDMFNVTMSLSVGMVARSLQAAKSATGIDKDSNIDHGSHTLGVQEDGTLDLTRGQLFSRPDLVAVDGVIYDLKAFAPKHPGGSLILGTGGTDATAVFYEMHPEFVIKRAKRKLEEYRVGTLVANSDDDESATSESANVLIDPRSLFPKGVYIHGGAGW
jgi:cytochrome b involved in lipid metabolism